MDPPFIIVVLLSLPLSFSLTSDIHHHYGDNYFVVLKHVPFKDAESTCQEYGGTLVRLTFSNLPTITLAAQKYVPPDGPLWVRNIVMLYDDCLGYYPGREFEALDCNALVRPLCSGHPRPVRSTGGH